MLFNNADTFFGCVKSDRLLGSIDQIQYVLTGMSTSASMVSDQELPWRKTISGNGFITATMVVSYDKSLDSVSNRSFYKKLKNTEITISILREGKVLAKNIYQPSKKKPSAQIALQFGEGQAVSNVSINGSINIGNTEPEVVVSDKNISDDNNLSSDYTFEVLAKPINNDKQFLKEVERLRYLLAGAGVNSNTLNHVKLPWRKTITRDNVSSAELDTEYINSLDPFFNKNMRGCPKIRFLRTIFIEEMN